MTSTQEKFLIATYQAVDILVKQFTEMDFDTAVDILVKQFTEMDFDTALQNFRTSFKNSKLPEPTFWDVRKQPDIGSGREIHNQSNFQYYPETMKRLAKIPKKT